MFIFNTVVVTHTRIGEGKVWREEEVEGRRGGGEKEERGRKKKGIGGGKTGTEENTIIQHS